MEDKCLAAFYAVKIGQEVKEGINDVSWLKAS